MSCESLCPGFQKDSSLLATTSHGRRGEGAPWGLFYKGPDLFMENMTYLPPKGVPPNAFTLGVRV